MSKSILTASMASTVATILFASLPAYAQSNPSPSGYQQQQPQQQQTPLTENRVRQSLEQAGFKDITVVDSAYLVQARTNDGNIVTMWIDPPTMVEAISRPLNHPTNQMATTQGQVGSTGYGSQGYQGNMGQRPQQGYIGQGNQNGSMPFGAANYGPQGGRYWQGNPQQSANQYESPRNQGYQAKPADQGTSPDQSPNPNQGNQKQ